MSADTLLLKQGGYRYSPHYLTPQNNPHPTRALPQNAAARTDSIPVSTGGSICFHTQRRPFPHEPRSGFRQPGTFFLYPAERHA